jgi:hypothetical protein
MVSPRAAVDNESVETRRAATGAGIMVKGASETALSRYFNRIDELSIETVA